MTSFLITFGVRSTEEHGEVSHRQIPFIFNSVTSSWGWRGGLNRDNRGNVTDAMSGEKPPGHAEIQVQDTGPTAIRHTCT